MLIRSAIKVRPGPMHRDPWMTAWVAEIAGKGVGVGLAKGDRVDDPWISRSSSAYRPAARPGNGT